MNPYYIIIPARFDSSRLPGKVLRDIAGKTMLQRVFEAASVIDSAQIIIATDNRDVFTVAEQFGADVCMTREDHPNGTARITEVIEQRAIADDAIVVNLQADEPLMPAALPMQVHDCLLQDESAGCASLMTPITERADIFDPNTVKVVCDKQGYALYFSRAPIAWQRGSMSPDNDDLALGHHYRHIGLYAYRAGFVQRYVRMQSCDLERLEQLEQLRLLWHGEKIRMAEACQQPPSGVDTEADLRRIQTLFQG